MGTQITRFLDKKYLPIALVALAVVSRLLPHPANVAPITAIALYCAVYMDKKYSILLPMVGLFLSDLVIGFYGPTMLAVYGSFLVTALIGQSIKKNVSFVKIILAAVASSVVFYLITNFAVWLFDNMYTKDLTGLITCYIAAVPFFRNTLLGDLFYTIVLFGVTIPNLSLPKVSVKSVQQI